MNVIGSYSKVVVAASADPVIFLDPPLSGQRNVRSIAVSSLTAGTIVVEIVDGQRVGPFIIEDLEPAGNGVPAMAKTDDPSLPVLRGSQSLRIRNLAGAVVTVTYSDWQ